jgi:hypothetical protein
LLTDELVIGDSVNNGNLKYVDGNQNAGYVLTSDSQGYASWQPSTGGGGGTGATNTAYVQIVDFTQDVSETINHNLGSDSIHIQLIDLDGSEIIEGHFDNYTSNTVDVTLSADNNNVKVVIFATGGVEITSLEQLTDVALTSPLLDGEVLVYEESSGFWVNSTAAASVSKAVVTFTPGVVGSPNTVTHSLGTADIIVQLWDVTTGEVIYADINNATATDVDITFGVNPAGDVKAVII